VNLKNRKEDLSMQFVAEFFASFYGAVFVSLSIFFFGVYQYSKRFLSRLHPIERELDNATSLLNRFSNEKDFYENFEEFKEEISKLQYFGKVWNEFKKTLIIPRKNEGNSVIVTKSVYKYFVLSDLGINNTIAGRLNSIPGTLTGLGILGTFIGLSCGIYLAKNGLTAGDTKEVTESLGHLLNGASLAFSTSISGLIASILFSRGKYKNLDRFENKLRAFNSLLSNLMAFKSEEALLFESVNEAKIQTTCLKNFSTELTTSIGIALEEKVTGNLTPLMEKLLESVENLSNKQSEVGSAAIEQASKAMNENMVSQMGSQMTLLGETFRNLFATLERSSEMISNGQSEIQNQSKQMADSVRDALDDSAEILKSKFGSAMEDYSSKIKSATEASAEEITSIISSISRMLSESFDRTQLTASKVESSVNLLLEFTEKQKSSNDSIFEVVDKLGATSNILVKTGEPLNSATQGLKEMIVTLAPLLKGITEVSRDINQNVFQVREANEELDKIWKDHQERFENVDESLKKAFEQIVTGLRGYTENVQTFHASLDDSVSKIVNQLAGAVGEFGSQIEDLAEVMTTNK
jgi:methyl-accepting chemotaxis protein